MDELERERRTLELANRDLNEGQQRIRRQEQLVQDLEERGQDASRARDLLATFRRTQAVWEQHRQVIAARIAYLEAKQHGER